MGSYSKFETHVKRSSSMSFALRWKRENMRLIAVLAGISCVLTFMFVVLHSGTAAKSVVLVVDGKETIVHTKQWTVQRLLAEHSVEAGQNDRLSAPLETVVKKGQRYSVDHTFPVQIKVDGQIKTVFSTAATVGGLLQENHFALGEYDKVIPGLESGISADGQIQIVRVTKEIEEISEPVPYEIVKQNNASMLKGKEQVIQEGKQGIVLKHMEKVYEDGILVSVTMLGEKLQSETVDKIVAVGTKNNNVVTTLSVSSPSVKEVSVSGITFGVKQILNNVKLTAYSSGVASTGKKNTDSEYGITYTGTRVKEGRTIAVDPKVIPLGWWVYIDGIGFRRAEDIGGGVKGSHIDIYYDSEEYVNRFGMKRGYTVYVIGPKKPTED